MKTKTTPKARPEFAAWEEIMEQDIAAQEIGIQCVVRVLKAKRKFLKAMKAALANGRKAEARRQ